MTGVWPLPPTPAAAGLHQIQPSQNPSHKASQSISPYYSRRRGRPKSKDEYCRAASDDTVRSVDETSSSGSRDPREVRLKACVDRIVLCAYDLALVLGNSR